MYCPCMWFWRLFLPIFLSSLFFVTPGLSAQEIHSVPQPLVRLQGLLSGVWCQPLEEVSSYELLQYSCEELASICEELADLIEQDREEDTPYIRRTTELLLGLMQKAEPYLPVEEWGKWAYEVATLQLLMQLLDEEEPVYEENGWHTIPCRSKSFWKGIGNGLASAKHQVVKTVRHLGREIREHPVRSLVIAGAAAGLGFGIYVCCSSSPHGADPIPQGHTLPPERRSSPPPQQEERSEPPSPDEQKELQTLVFDLVAADTVQDLPSTLAESDSCFLDEATVEARFAVHTEERYRAGVEAVKGIAHGGVDFQWRTIQDLEAVAFLIGSGEVEASFDERRMIMDSFLRSQASQTAAVEDWVQEALNIDPSDSTYQQFRAGTEKTLEIGSIAIAGYGVGKGIMKIGTRKVVAELGEILSAGRNATGELALVKDCTTAVHQLEKAAVAEVRVGRMAVNEPPPPAHRLERLVEAEAVAVLDCMPQVGDFKYTKTVYNHIHDIVKSGPYKGELARPYLQSSQVVQEIMAGGVPIPDPRGIPGALRWDVAGTFRGSEGTWELVLHPDNLTVYHFNFVTR